MWRFKWTIQIHTVILWLQYQVLINRVRVNSTPFCFQVSMPSRKWRPAVLLPSLKTCCRTWPSTRPTKTRVSDYQCTFVPIKGGVHICSLTKEHIFVCICPQTWWCLPEDWSSCSGVLIHRCCTRGTGWANCVNLTENNTEYHVLTLNKFWHSLYSKLYEKKTIT